MGQITSPLTNVLKRLADQRIEHGPAAAIEHRFTNASDIIAVLCDCSGSMLDEVGSSNLSKFEHLRIALADLEKGYRKMRLIAFGSTAIEIYGTRNLPDPSHPIVGGGTNLEAALELAARWKPRKTIILSDGMPTGYCAEERCLAAVENMTGSIDAIYCGPDDHPAVAFLQSLTRSTGGTQVTWTGRHELTGLVRALLPPPE